MNIKKWLAGAAILCAVPVSFAWAVPQAQAVPPTGTERRLAEYTPDHFIGFWEDDATGESRLTVTPGEKGWYGVEISWQRSRNQSELWTMSAVPAEGYVLEYRDCIHYRLTFNGTVVEREEILYEEGTGRICLIGDRKILWEDDQDHTGAGSVYVPLKSPLGGGL